MREKTQALLPIIFLTFVNTLGFSILIPVTPYIIAEYQQSALMYGVLIASYALCQLIAAPYLGALSDKYGRRPILLTSQLGTLLSWVLFGIAYFVPVIAVGPTVLPIAIIMLARTVDGITGGNVSVANAYISDISSPEQKVKNFGLLGAVGGIGFMVGPILGGLSSGTFGFIGTAVLAGAISALTLYCIWRYLPESLAAKDRSAETKIYLWSEINLFAKLRHFASDRYLGRLFFVRLFFYLCFSSYTTIFVLFASQRYALSPQVFGFLFFFVGTFVIFNQGFLVPRLTKRYGALRTLHLGYATMAGGLLLMLSQPSLTAFIVISYVINFGFSASLPTFKALIANRVTKQQQGQIMGLDESLLAASNATGPLLAGLVYTVVPDLAFAIFAMYLVIPYAILAGVRAVRRRG